MAEAKGPYVGVEFISDQERLHFEEARLGETVREFLVSPVGRYLHGRALIQLQEAQTALVDCTPENLAELQRSAKQAQTFMFWLADAISNGEMAYQNLKEYRDE
jgi:hypothetical protein